MPANLRELRAALLSVFEELSGLPTYWLNNQRPQAPGVGTGYTDPDGPIEPKKLAWLLLNMTTLERVGGNDEQRVCDVEENPEQIQTLLVKQRKFRLDVKCESFDQDDPALGYLDDLSGAMSLPAGRALLLATDLALIESGIAVSRDEALGQFDSRIWSVAVQDLMFTVTLNDEQEPSDEWIECAELVPCISGSDGELLPESLNREQTICRPTPTP